MISLNAPYTIINSLPFDMRLFFNTNPTDPDSAPILTQNPNMTDLLCGHTDDSQVEVVQPDPHFTSGRKPAKKKKKEELKIIEESKREDDDSITSQSEFYDAEDHWGPPTHFQYLDMRSCDEISILDTQPEADFLVAIQPQMYRASNFLNVKNNFDESEEEIDLGEMQQTDEDNDHVELIEYFRKTCSFRFYKKKTFMFQVTSK